MNSHTEETYYPLLSKRNNLKRKMLHLLEVVIIAATDLKLKTKAEADSKVNKFHNYGLPFSFLKERPKWVIGLPLVITSGLLGIWTASVTDDKTPEAEKTALSLMLAGGISNVVDRLKRGYVVDYLNIPKGKMKHFFFNIGDAAIILGSGVYFIWTVVSRRKS